ncbi:SNF-related serine/threonine-protein kinase-like [Coturnix japonica]|uniref:SNF-related serine/threonine-protein kinase-like n=1 Tax=Coturnix japonica TaxID=93934 RepID=UPI0007774ACD|nr:SNF-related serine/threonine-protein kinase-like [Coturnix japonica]XP_032303001.1 SNF-related serine/threonine-protein kinase-like [Coturnix japonica]
MAEGKIAGLYDLERTLGKGHFAVVKLARHVFTGQRVAVKVIDKSKLAGEAAGQLLQEVRCMKLVQHPNVVRLYEVIDTHAKLYLILELGDGGDMFDHIMRHEGGLAEPRAKHYFAQIVHAISYCHKLHVVHRDLKPENVVFFQEQGLVKLTDFGFSNRFQPGKMLTTSCGSLAYSAPEILLGDEYDAPAVDIWSLGVILYMLVCGQPPFQEANDSETLTMIMDCRYTVPPHVSAQCSDLISRMLQRDPRQRASLEQIEAHAWLQGVDPSPASRCLLPLTSHKRVSQEEHEIIIQAMSCGHIADRDTIQEALEADRYNHITATYFLLAERMLREKQEAQSRLQELARQTHGRTGPSDALSAGVRQPAALGPGSSQPSTGDGGRARVTPRVLLKAPTIDTAITKSSPALQQICEEEEEEEEEECRPGAVERKSSSLNQEQMRDFLRAGARRGPHRGEPGGWAGGRGGGGARGAAGLRGDGTGRAGEPGGSGGTGHTANREQGKERAGEQSGGAGESDGENVIKADPGKGKSGLRERLLQIPLCEKALAFKIRPGPKDGLLPIGQFSCCHVI